MEEKPIPTINAEPEEKAMWCRLRKVKTIGLMLVALMLWHFGGVRLYAQARSIERQQETEAARRAPFKAPKGHFDALLNELKDVIKQGAEKSKASPEKGFAGIDKLSELKASLIAENEKNENYFSQMESTIKAKGLAAEILTRHQEFVRGYETKYQTLLADLESIESVHKDATGLWGKISGKNKQIDWDGPVSKTLRFLDENTPRPPQHNFDPHNLPHRSLKADKPILPKLTREDWDKALSTDFADSTDSKAAPNDPGLATQRLLLKPLATSPPTAADLAETIEVKFTPEIRQLADSLGRNPVKIFNWVRNNIEFVPTWGSIQGAQLCMESKNCNAFDTSSLLIALLRVSGIPARYQMGTIEVPIDNARNWLGGFTDARAAARFAASGGVPSAGTVEQGGVLRSIRMEHVWVKAYLDYGPSGGGINIQGDTWVDVDPSFKLYAYNPGENVVGALGLDISALRNHLNEITSVNEGETFVLNYDTSFIESVFNTSVNNLSTAYPTTNDFAPLLPGHVVVKKELPIIAARTPYRTLSRGPAFATLPSALRHKITLSVADLSGGVVLTYATSLPEVATKEISLVYKFASNADINTVKSIAGQQTPDIRQLRTLVEQIPAYLVGVCPVIQLDGVEVARASRVGMGNEQQLIVHLDAPTVQTPDVTTELAAWGHCAITLDLAGISDAMMLSRSAKITSLLQQFQASHGRGQTVAPLLSSFHDLVGSAWFFTVDRSSKVLAKTFGIAFARFPSLAFSFQNAKVFTIFGIPHRVIVDDYFLDAARQLHVITALNGDQNLETGFNFAAGFRSSSLEGIALRELLGDRSSPGVTAASALGAASQQGIPIYAIDSGNMQSALMSIDDRFPKDRISDAVNAGRLVLVPQRPPLIGNIFALGYVTLDSRSGDGAYLIGRARGSEIHCEDLPHGTPGSGPDPQDECFALLNLADALEEIGIALLVAEAIFAVVAAFVAGIPALVAGGTIVTIIGAAAFSLAFSEMLLEIEKLLDEYENCKRRRLLHPGIACANPFLKFALEVLKDLGHLPHAGH